MSTIFSDSPGISWLNCERVVLDNVDYMKALTHIVRRCLRYCSFSEKLEIMINCDVFNHSYHMVTILHCITCTCLCFKDKFLKEVLFTLNHPLDIDELFFTFRLKCQIIFVLVHKELMVLGFTVKSWNLQQNDSPFDQPLL